MIGEGEHAPSFELPAVIRGRPGWVSLDDFLGESVVVLAFYPADFNPSCTDNSTDLDEFDVFRMQSDATVLAISGDSVYSHRAFAQKHDLRLPLLADVQGEVAEAYGVASDDARYPTRRAVVVIDNDGMVTYTWLAENVEERPSIEEVQTAFGDVGDADLAETQYREGCDRYDEGRDTFVEGMRAYERRDWVLACSEFEAASETLEVADDAFRRAARFSEDEAMTASFERGKNIAGELRRAVGLFSDAASAHAGGDLRRGERLRGEGEDVLEALQELGAPPDPNDLPVDIEDDSPTGEGSLDLDAVFEMAEAEETPAEDAGDDDSATEDGASTGAGADTASIADGSADTPGEDDIGEAADIDEDDDIAEEELEALTAEIETQDASDAPDDRTANGSDENGDE